MTRFFTQRTLTLLTAGLLYQASLLSEGLTEESVHTDRFTLRHIESKGIGYNQGYTTFEAFFIPVEILKGRWVPFLDGRAHIFNNGKPAANVGAGLRYLNSRIWGANLYYDFRKTHKLNYSQISCGLETIGEKVDARINGYFPVGKHTSTHGSTTFDYFKGNQMYLVKKEEFALQGVNAELGIHLGRSKKMNFYTAFGPYYFLNNSKQAIGGSFRISMIIRESFTLEANTSYDSLFKWIGQGQVSIAYAFKPKKFDRLHGRKKNNSPSFDIRSRILQKVDKFEIIVTDTKKHKSLAINPATGQPYFFLFLDPKNPENGSGTFESPFNSLAAIPDLIPITQPPHEILPTPIILSVTQEISIVDNIPTLTSSTPKEEQIILVPADELTPILTQTPSIILETPIVPPIIPKAEQIILVPAQQQPLLQMTPILPPVLPKVEEILLVPGRGQELQTTLGTVMVPASQKGHPKITHVKDIEYQGKKTHVFVITMEDEETRTE